MHPEPATSSIRPSVASSPFLVLALALLLAGCGQKGALVLPDTPPATSESSEEDTDSDDG